VSSSSLFSIVRSGVPVAPGVGSSPFASSFPQDANTKSSKETMAARNAVADRNRTNSPRTPGLPGEIPPLVAQGATHTSGEPAAGPGEAGAKENGLYTGALR